jgi:hypothetical protein
VGYSNKKDLVPHVYNADPNSLLELKKAITNFARNIAASE